MSRGLDLIAAHLVGDYVLQSDEMAKKKLDNPLVRAYHVSRYTAALAPAALASGAPWRRQLLFLGLAWMAHYVTDSKRWLPDEAWAPGAILNDQALHAVQLAILERLLRGAR